MNTFAKEQMKQLRFLRAVNNRMYVMAIHVASRLLTSGDFGQNDKWMDL